MPGKAEAAVANRGCVKFMPTGSTLAVAERATPAPIILADRRDVAFAINFVADPTLSPITRPVMSCLMPSGFTRSSIAKWRPSIPIIDACAGSRPHRAPETPLILLQRGYGSGWIVGRKIFARRWISEATCFVKGGMVRGGRGMVNESLGMVNGGFGLESGALCILLF